MTLRMILFGLALAGAAAPGSAQSTRVAHPQLGPIISDKGGQTVGEIADILGAVAEREHFTIVFVPMSANTAQTLESGTADAVAPFLATPEAAQRYDFTATLITSGGGLFSRAPSTAPDDLRSLAGKTVVTPSSGPFVHYIQANFPSVRLVTAATYQECLDRVVAGEADAAALNIQEGASVVSESYGGKVTVPSAPFLRESLVLAVLKGTHADLLVRIDAGLAAMRADGTLDRIVAKWTTMPAKP